MPSFFTQQATFQPRTAEAVDVVVLDTYQAQFIDLRERYGGETMFSDVTALSPSRSFTDTRADAPSSQELAPATSSPRPADIPDLDAELEAERIATRTESTKRVSDAEPEIIDPSSPCADVRPGSACALLETSKTSTVAAVTEADRQQFDDAVKVAIDSLPRSINVTAPDLSTMTLDEVIAATERIIQARLNQIGEGGDGCGLPCILAAIFGGGLLIALVTRREEKRGVSGLGQAKGGPSRGLRVAFLGATSGLAAHAAAELSGFGFLSSIGGGAVAAPVHNQFFSDPSFEGNLGKLAIYGAAAGTTGRGFAESFAADTGRVPPFLSRLFGSALGGAVGALAADSFAPEELRLEG